MEDVTTAAVEALLARTGSRLAQPARLYLLGGCALLAFGSPRATKDIDYDVGADAGASELHVLLDTAAAELGLDAEHVPLAEFIPLPPGAAGRHRFHGRYDQLEVYLFDPYSIALSKIARGFEADIEDVVFMLRAGVVHLAVLGQLFQAVLPDAPNADIDADEFQAYFAELIRRVAGEA